MASEVVMMLDVRRLPNEMVLKSLRYFNFYGVSLAAIFQLIFEPGKAAKSNVELVERIVSLVHQAGYKVATCDEAREMLGVRK